MAVRSRKRGGGSYVVTLALVLVTGSFAFAALEAQQLTVAMSPVALSSGPQAVDQAKPASDGSLADAPGAPPSYSETVARPLFNPSRRPIALKKPKVVEAPPPPPLQPLKAELIGLAAIPADGGRALLRTANDRPASWLTVGEELGGWRLSEIRQDRVVFRSGEHQQVLHLFPVREKARRTQ